MFPRQFCVAAMAGLLAASAARADSSISMPMPLTALPAGFGVNIHFTHPRAGEVKQLADAGFTFVRMDFGWDRIEKKRGEYDWSQYEDLLAALKPYGIRAVFILDYVNRLYDDNRSPDTDEGRAAFAKWAAAAATHFKGRGIVWEMYNEPNIKFWRPTPNTADYIKLALTVGKALRAAQPNDIYVGPACSTMDFKFLEACFDAGCLEYFQAVSVHPYRPSSPETVAEDYRRLRMLIEKYKPKGKAIPIFSGEWGYSSSWSSMTEEKQGTYLPRQWLTNVSNDVPLSIWYDWHDDGKDPKEPEHHFGSVHNDYSPKPAYLAAKKLTTELAGYRFNKRLLIDRDDDYVLLFEKGDELKLAAWTIHEPHKITLPTADISIDLTNDVQYIAANGNAAMATLAKWKRAPLDVFVEAPRLIDGPNLSIMRGQEFVQFDAPSDVSPAIKQRITFVVTNALKLAIQPARGHGLIAQVDNPSGQPFVGSIITGQSKTPVKMNDQRRIVVPLPDADAASPEVRDEKGQLVLRSPAMRFVRPDLSLDKYVVRAEGDKDVKSTQTLAAGENSGELKITYNFEAGWKYACVHPKKMMEIEGKPQSIGIWVTGDGSGNHLRLRAIDSTGQTFQPDGPRLTFKDRRFVSFAFDGGKVAHWGGADDGEIHFPIKLETLLLIDSADRRGTNGVVTIDSPAIVYEDSAATGNPR